MNDKWRIPIFAFLFAGALLGCTSAASRIKDIAEFEGVRDNQLTGIGLLVGLNGTGDRSQTFFSTQMIANMLQRSGITIDPERVRVKNIATVMVRGTLPPFVRQGSRIDVDVASIGDAQSIQGGLLISTPLKGPDGQVYAVADGSVVLGGYSAGGRNARAQLNHPTAGRIPNGGLVEKEVLVDFTHKKNLNLVLHSTDFTTASRAAKAINESVGSAVAGAVDGRTIAIKVPQSYENRIVEYMSEVENATMDVDIRARVVINEKTGTIVMGNEVKISQVSIIHGSLTLQVGTVFNVSQPAPFSREGDTVVVPEETVSVQEEKGGILTMHEGASVEEIVTKLNAFGASPRDVIAILKAIKAHGALQAELEII
ncbi:MAG: flagellar basal body P-ring protein FlgI [Acidobacteria bacterium]|nr:flagellar basal body P-ring protein FlgI [Acidobacteriota bacterium]